MSKLRLALAVGNRDFCSLFEDYISMCCDIELVGSTTDGLVALELVKQKKPDVLVMDNVMTRIDGLGVLTKLQNTIAFKRPKVIMNIRIGESRCSTELRATCCIKQSHH